MGKGGSAMQLTIGEKIKIIMGRQNMTLSQLAEKIGQSRQNISNKMSRDNFTEQEAREIASALGAEFIGAFRFQDGTEI
jgi:transcriptional regulator with XRE-family HTH domain